MVYCRKCGAEQPKDYIFCTKCGAKLDEPSDEIKEHKAAVQYEQPAENDVKPAEASPVASANQTKPIDWLKTNFIPLYVILGVVSIVLLQFSTMIAFSALGFGVTLGVFAILCAIAFCAVGVVNFVSDGNKHTARDIICLALGIIGFIYVLVTAIVVLKAASDLLDAINALVQIMMAM